MSDTLKFQLSQYNTYHDLPLENLNLQKCSIYIVDYDWDYLFANTYAIDRLNGIDLVGKHVQTVWKENPKFNFEPVYNMLKENVALKKPLSLRSRSPVTNRVIQIVGHPLHDCYYFSIYELPDKESLISELKSLLKNRDIFKKKAQS